MQAADGQREGEALPVPDRRGSPGGRHVPPGAVVPANATVEAITAVTAVGISSFIFPP